MSFDLDLRPRSASERASELERVLRGALDDYRGKHPEVRPADVEQALRRTLRAESTGGADEPAAPAPVPDDAEVVRRTSWIGALLMVMLIVAMLAALLLIRRP